MNIVRILKNGRTRSDNSNRDQMRVSSRWLNFEFGQMGNEEKITNGKIESLHSMVNRLEQEVTTFKGKHSISAASRPLRAVVGAAQVLGFLVVRVCGYRRVSN